MYLKFNVDAGAQRMTIVPRGELDLGNVAQMVETIRQGRSEGVLDFTVDGAELTYCDCAGLGAMMTAYEDAFAAGRRFALIRPQPIVGRLIRIAGCQELLAEESPAAA